MKTFDVLSLEDKVDLVLKEGIHLETVPYSIYRADLYSISDFFVEVLLFPQTCDFVHIRLVNERSLEKYLYPIHLTVA